MNNETFYIFYDESRLLKTLVYFPYIQLMIIVVFVTFGYITFRSSKQDEQNRVWIGPGQGDGPSSSGRPPRRCWAGSSTCARSPSTRRPSRR